jgi:hypothetical protein
MTKEIGTILNDSVQVTKNPLLKFQVPANPAFREGTAPIKLVAFVAFLRGFILA